MYLFVRMRMIHRRNVTQIEESERERQLATTQFR